MLFLQNLCALLTKRFEFSLVDGVAVHSKDYGVTQDEHRDEECEQPVCAYQVANQKQAVLKGTLGKLSVILSALVVHVVNPLTHVVLAGFALRLLGWSFGWALVFFLLLHFLYTVCSEKLTLQISAWIGDEDLGSLGEVVVFLALGKSILFYRTLRSAL